MVETGGFPTIKQPMTTLFFLLQPKPPSTSALPWRGNGLTPGAQETGTPRFARYEKGSRNIHQKKTNMPILKRDHLKRNVIFQPSIFTKSLSFQGVSFVWYQFFSKGLLLQNLGARCHDFGRNLAKQKSTKTKSERLDLYLLAHGTGMSMLLSKWIITPI